MKRATVWERHLKVAFDYLAAVLVLTLLAPFMVLLAILVKLDSSGPVFFRQRRLGKDGRVFGIYKFRTMVDGAEKTGSGIFTSRSDPRITRVGRLLRRTSLDELPQLINVLRGEMSIVGPRPPVPYHPYSYEAYTGEQRLRFAVRPGITGYAQVSGRNLLSWDERMVYDAEYVKRWSLRLDAWVLLKTLRVVSTQSTVFSGRERQHR